MKQVFIRRGTIAVEEVPEPGVEPGSVLVRVARSCISPGTELAGLRTTEGALWKRALRQPENVKAAVGLMMKEGPVRALRTVQGVVESGLPTGYSAAGIVLANGAGVDDLGPGARVACAGATHAHHAEVVCVPRNLVVPIPDGLSFEDASTVALGAIALQGVRRAKPTLGEVFVVVGLGVLGQITVQILRANGCRVIAVDPDPARTLLSERSGAELGLRPEDLGDGEQVSRITGGIGADGVIITASTSSDDVMSSAFRMCRKRARVVLVGDVGLNLKRSEMYAKELDFLVSTSYGPGRYDRRYEDDGLDYPVSHVRWTENRNMDAYLRLLSLGDVVISALPSVTVPVDRAADAYQQLSESTNADRALVGILVYPDAASPKASVRRVPNPSAVALRSGKIGIAVVGAGSFASSVHLPNLSTRGSRYQLRAVVGRSGHSAWAAARRFGAAYATTEFDAVLADPTVQAVLIATRHDLHAQQALSALQAGKHVLVEKPLALSRDDLETLEAFYRGAGSGAPILCTGFNRRFSPHVQRLKELISPRSNPLLIDYRMNAGRLPPDHWALGREGGGRNLGEACHIYDLFGFLSDSEVERVSVEAIAPTTPYYSRHDNFCMSARFRDGTIGTLTYTSMGSADFPKEQCDVFCDGKVLHLDDYRRMTVAGHRAKPHTTMLAEKGHREELDAFASAIQSGGPWPIPLWQQVQATEIAFRVEAVLAAGN